MARGLMYVTEPFVCRTLQEDDDNAVIRLVQATFSRFLEGKFWEWKYLRNPFFDRSFVAVAENDGKIVGCNHWLLRTLKLSNSVAVDGVLGSDIAVAPEYRNKGVGRAMIHFLRSQHKERKLAVMYMFANPELTKHFHTPVAGYIPAPGGTLSYTKILNWNKVVRNAAAFSEEIKHRKFGDKLVNADLTVVFRMHGAPPLFLHINSKGANTDYVSRADVTIISDVTTLSKIKDKKVSSWRLVEMLLTGKLKFRGSIRKLLTFYRNLWVFREILSGKIT